MGLGNDFLYMISKAQATKAKIDKCDCIKLRSFCTAKETISRVKSNLWNGRKHLQTILCDKGLISKIYKELEQLNSKKSK